jgi:hypothetical protein
VKKLIFVVGVLAAAGVFVRGTPQCSYFLLRQALESGDVETVEKHADLDAAISTAADVAAAGTEESARDAAGDVGAKIAGLFAGLFQLANPLGPAVKDELKTRIAKKEYATEWGAFVPGSPLKDMLSVQKLDTSALLTVSGTCHGKEAALKLVMEKRPGPVFGLINDWKITGVDKTSLPAFARVCVNGK